MSVRMKPCTTALTVTPCARALHKETAVACVRIVEDGEVSRCRQTPFAALPSMRNLAPENTRRKA
jgi:hypothetical protein